ncbi:glycosyltransferase family 1 protein [Segetibacter sp. 3557_3]|uniref:glycosyltransferase family 4 protein n=1 Tax=Segetibacter sp. 3557_3 TaxID=2547429 RepID=UPI001058F017|nr:glycosyltransferase family 1 protein [Segetibacter sp. 3557_3]TDH27833.1 glycosyltransferase family 1 protein [Segetibacter sp. 3557_3]
MSKIRVGVVIDAESVPTEGGGHAYYNRLLKGINDFSFNENVDIVNVVFYAGKVPELQLTKRSIYIKTGYGSKAKRPFRIRGFKYANLYLNKATSFLNFILHTFITNRNKKVERALRENGIDLLYYLKPRYAVLNFPFIATHWDIAHRSVYAFPEMIMNGEYEAREEYYLYTLNKAMFILCESDTGAKELLNFYALYKSKVKVVPAFGGNIINLEVPSDTQKTVLDKFGLVNQSYFLYPAQFWAHKNHYNLIVAFAKLLAERKQTHLQMVLCGSDKGNAAYIQELVNSLGLNGQVKLLGFVPDSDLSVLYQNALALTMATFLGPTNMPLIEAAHLSCPVLCSDLEGHREILGDHALYFDPADSNSIKHALIQVLDNGFRSKHSLSAQEYIRSSKFNLSNSLSELNAILVSAISIRRTWGLNFLFKREEAPSD